MASILIIEDTTGTVEDANSYVAASDARAYAALRGITLPAAPTDLSVDVVETALVRACDYLESLSFVGKPVNTTQALKWPRFLSYACAYFSESTDYMPVIPDKLKAAQCQLVVEQLSNSIDLMPSRAGGTQFVIREKVDVIETAYSERLGTLSTPTMPKVDALLDGLVVRGGGSLRAERV